MELLNLDSLLTVSRQITLNGVDYNVVEQSVEQMIIGLQVQKQIDKNPDGTFDDEETMKRILESVSSMIPNCPKEQIKRLPMRAIYAIFEFVNASDKEAVNSSKVEQLKDESDEPEKK